MKRSFTDEITSNNDSSNDDSIDMTIRRQDKLGKNLIRSKYADIKIKVDADIYHLDRLHLASKSDYFEKLFIEDFREKKHDILELSVVDSDTFSTIVDMIYGQELKSVLNADNYVVLLMAMDYFQMKIDMKVYGKFIKNFIQKKPFLDSNIFKLCEYVAENKNFDDLTPFVYTCMSAHFTEVRDHEEFLFLTLDQVVGLMCGERINFAEVTDIRQCSQACVKWIFHDAENRLPHAIKLVNAVKRRLSLPYRINDEDFKVKMSNAGEEVTPDNVLKYFVETVIFQGEIGMYNIVTQQMKTPRESYDFNKSSIDQNERDKMIRFLENGDLSDIVVRIEGKTYKLHRCKLLSESGYFANVFSAQNSETSDQPNKDEEYLLDVEGVDEKSFEASIRYIYHKKLELNFDTIVSVLKTACILKIDRLMSDCDLWIVRKLDEISLEIVVEILKFIRNADLIIRFEKMYKCLLSRRILKAWSARDDCSLFCAIPIGMLEDWLTSCTLHKKINEYSLPENLGFDDSNKLVDICSKWVMEDVQNRYQLIPRIARAINCNLKMNCNDYKMETPDLSRCSEQLVRVQLMSVLLSTPLIDQDAMLKNTPRKITDEPVFVTSSETMIKILNCEMERVVSLWFSDFHVERDVMVDCAPFSCFVSATTMGDMLFIAAHMFIVDGVYHDYLSRIFFQAYNISSKKFTSLAYLPQRGEYEYSRYKLLNCRRNIYCCFEDGIIFKYVMHLNRWSQFYNREADVKMRHIRFASDGKELYKLYETEKPAGYQGGSKKTKKIFETYDFDRNLWIPEPEMTMDSNNMSDHVVDFTTMKNGDVAVLLPEMFWILDENSRSWRMLPLSASYCDWFLNIQNATITQWEDRLLLYLNRQLHCYQLSDSNQSWQVVKENQTNNDEIYQYFGCLTSVHRPAMYLV